MRTRLAALLAALVTILGLVFITPAQATSTENLFGSTSPLVTSDPDSGMVELGIQFKSSTAGRVTGIRFYKGSANTGVHIGKLYSGSNMVQSIAFSNETPSGWQQASFANPVTVVAGRIYTASYVAPNGHYSVTDPYAFPMTAGNLTAIKGVYRYGGGFPSAVYRHSNYLVDLMFVADSGGPAPTTTPTTPTTPTTTTTTTTTTPPTSGGFPDSSNTGIPAGITLSSYTGPCTITVSNTAISGKLISCDLIIKAAGVSVSNSRINGRLISNTSSASVTVQDSVINGGNQEVFPSVSYQNLTLRRVEVIGGQHSVQCSANCTVVDSWLHNQYIGAGSKGHVNAFISNGGSGFTLTHNTLHCTVQPTGTGGGCTADASLFGDFGPISNAKFDRNLFKANSTGAGYCLQAGYNPGKAFPNPTGVSITNNVFERGTNGKCGIYGPYTAFKVDAPGAVWSGNKFDNGVAIN